MKLAAIFIATALVGCGERVQNAPSAGENIHVPAFEWRVRSEQQLQEIHTLNGLTFRDGLVAEGLQGTDPTGRIAVYTLAPKIVDDRAACTLGHEIMHVALGKYHREQK